MSELLPVPSADRALNVGGAGTRPDENSLRKLICHIGRLMHESHWIDGYAGSISARLDNHTALFTPDVLAKGFLQPEQIQRISLDAAHPEGDRSLHVACYRARPDAGAVVHAHPPHAVALTLAGVTMRSCVLPESVILLGLVPTAAILPPDGPDTADAVRALSADYDAFLLSHHGAITLAGDVWLAYLRMEVLEHTASILHRAAQIGQITPLPPEQVRQLLARRKALGYWRPGDDERFCQMCGAC